MLRPLNEERIVWSKYQEDKALDKLRSQLSSFTMYWKLVWCLGTERMYSVFSAATRGFEYFAESLSFSETDMVRTLPDSQDVVEVSL